MTTVDGVEYFGAGPDGPGWYYVDRDLKWKRITWILGPLPTRNTCEAEVEALWDRVDRRARGR